MKTYADPIDALGDPTRRRIFERLAEGPASVGTLADGMPVSRPAVSQHLRVLKDAGLVSDRQVGTRRIYAVDPAGVVALREYWDRLWSRALDGFRVAAEELASGRERGAQRRESNDGEGS